MIALPAYTGQIHFGTALSLLDSVRAAIAAGHTVDIAGALGNAMIGHSRNILLAKFLASDADCIVQIDHDLTWPADAFVRLVNAPVDFAAGVYPVRRDPIEFTVSYLDKPELWADPETGLLEVAAVPAGFFKVTRACVEKMYAAYPELEFEDVQLTSGKGVALFHNLLIDRQYYGEDISFCKRWTDIGGKIWVDPEITFTHIGNKSFHGCFGEWLRTRNG